MTRPRCDGAQIQLRSRARERRVRAMRVIKCGDSPRGRSSMNFSWIGFGAVTAGAALGAALRWWLSMALNHLSASIPSGTLLANLMGGLLAGIAMAWMLKHPELSPAWRLFITTGFLGGLTTFSTFSAESLALVLRGEIVTAAAHSALHLVGSLAAAALGYWLAS